MIQQIITMIITIIKNKEIIFKMKQIMGKEQEILMQDRLIVAGLLTMEVRPSR
jgi:hypothetical protein